LQSSCWWDILNVARTFFEKDFGSATGKKEGGMGEGIFARRLRRPVLPCAGDSYLLPYFL
jgi:hypothetical protein